MTYMKKFFKFSSLLLLSAASALVVSSCHKDIIETAGPEPEGGEGNGDKALVTFVIDGAEQKQPGTRASSFGAYGPSNVSASSFLSSVNRFTVFLWKQGQTNLYTYLSSTDGGSVSASINPGTYTAYAFVNHTVGTSDYGYLDPTSVTTVESLLNHASYYSNNTVSVNGSTSITNNLVMFGSMTFSVSAGSGATKSIPVQRLSSLIGIKKVTVDFSGEPLLSGCEFTLDRMYAINVYSRCQLGADYTPSQLNSDSSYWISPRVFQNGYGSTTTLQSTINTAINAYGGTRSSYFDFFVVSPNPITTEFDSQSSTWSPRCTRVVIEATIKLASESTGRKYYYYITPASQTYGIKRNNWYIADNVVIKGLGSSEPDEVNDNGLVEVNWTVTPITAWDTTYNVYENS